MSDQLPTITYDASYCDTILQYYSPELNDVPFSFSPIQDSVNKMKLFKAVFLYNSTSKTDSLPAIAKREFRFEIKRLELRATDEVLKLFDRSCVF